jgi:hypothetical protein
LKLDGVGGLDEEKPAVLNLEEARRLRWRLVQPHSLRKLEMANVAGFEVDGVAIVRTQHGDARERISYGLRVGGDVDESNDDRNEHALHDFTSTP